jgi:hypothetical protein
MAFFGSGNVRDKLVRNFLIHNHSWLIFVHRWYSLFKSANMRRKSEAHSAARYAGYLICRWIAGRDVGEALQVLTLVDTLLIRI